MASHIRLHVAAHRGPVTLSSSGAASTGTEGAKHFKLAPHDPSILSCLNNDVSRKAHFTVIAAEA